MYDYLDPDLSEHDRHMGTDVKWYIIYCIRSDKKKLSTTLSLLRHLNVLSNLITQVCLATKMYESPSRIATKQYRRRRMIVRCQYIVGQIIFLTCFLLSIEYFVSFPSLLFHADTIIDG